jgi:hypothetical protein
MWQFCGRRSNLVFNSFMPRLAPSYVNASSLATQYCAEMVPSNGCYLPAYEAARSLSDKAHQRGKGH